MKQTPWIVLSIDRTLTSPVFEQICMAIRTRIISGALAEGTKLPPTRSFATEIGVSRSTVVTAYEQLVAEGYLNSTQGSGYIICGIGEVELTPPPVQTNEIPEEEKASKPQAFQAGQPDMRLFPYRQWAKTVARVCRSNPQSMLTGGVLFGNFALRTAIAKHIADWRGISASPEQIIITAGATDALEICTQTLAKSGDRIGIEDPGYAPLHRFVKTQGLYPVYMTVDEQGANLPDNARNLRLAVLTPSHQYPLGGAMSPNRRMNFIHWAKATGGWIIEDDYDSEFRFSGRPIPAMAGFDQLNRTIYIGSFSKIFSNAMRLGYIVIPKELVARFGSAVKLCGLRASYMPQQALAEFIQSGEFYRHLRRMRRIYGERRKFLLERLTQDFSEYGSFVDHNAGMQIVFHLQSNLIDTEISRRAIQRGVTTDPLSSYCSNSANYNGLVMGYCGFKEAELAVALNEFLIVLRQGKS